MSDINTTPPPDGFKYLWKLELRERPENLVLLDMPEGFEVRKMEFPCPEFSWFLRRAVGTEYRWGGRSDWTEQKWTEFVNNEKLHTWIGYYQGAPAGYYELEECVDGAVEIRSFGLIQRFFGKGLGGPLLSASLQHAWDLGANYIKLITCSHDHPRALPNYLAQGFTLVEEILEPENPELKPVLFEGG